MLLALKQNTTGNLRKPWALRYDGDPNRLLLEAIICKGPVAIKFSKVTGHAKLEHIDAGITTAEHAAGNNTADEAAVKGHKLHQNDATNLAPWTAARASNATVIGVVPWADASTMVRTDTGRVTNTVLVRSRVLILGLPLVLLSIRPPTMLLELPRERLRVLLLELLVAMILVPSLVRLHVLLLVMPLVLPLLVILWLMRMLILVM